MSVRRALVECTVLSLQDPCVLYPSCKGCFSRIHTDSADTRLSCSKCGYSCARGLLDYRYRLSVRVAHGSCLFGVTVFGKSLNQFFGIHASGLQRVVTDKTGPLETLSSFSLLVKAVEECFIGKHFIFGIKVTENDKEPWVGRSNGSNNMSQVIATQMILPKAAGLRGCTVLSYFEAIFQKAAEAKLCTTNASKNAKLQRGPSWPTPHNSQTNGLTNDNLLPLALSRLQYLDSSLSPTPPSQQSLGLITSSAEQEERSQDVDESDFIEKDVHSSTPLKSWSGLSPTAHKTTCLTLHVMDYSTPDFTKSVLTECQVEFPLSESLTEFLNVKNTQNNMSLESVVHNAQFMDGSQPGVYEKHYESKSASTIKPNESSGDEQSESSVYNCSADLFSNSPRMDKSAEAFDNSPLQSVCVPISKGHIHTQPPVNASLTSKQPLSEKVEKCSTPNNQKLEKDEQGLRESFQLSPNLNFIPASQSTPAEKGNCIQSNLRKCTIENTLNGENQATLHYCVTPPSRYRKPGKLRYELWLNSRIYKRRPSRFGKYNTDDTLIVPPTPSNPHKSTYPHKAPFRPESKMSECAAEENKRSTTYEECDLSRDLFSDSV